MLHNNIYHYVEMGVLFAMWKQNTSYSMYIGWLWKALHMYFDMGPILMKELVYGFDLHKEYSWWFDVGLLNYVIWCLERWEHKCLGNITINKILIQITLVCHTKHKLE